MSDAKNGELFPQEERPRKGGGAKKQKQYIAGYAVAVMCRDEKHQREVFDELSRMGLPLKVLTL